MAKQAQASAQTSESGASRTSDDYKFILQSTMDMQRSIGQLTEAVNGNKETANGLKATVSSLVETVKEQGKVLNSISRLIYAAGAVAAVLAGVSAFILDKIWDSLAVLLKAAG
ncbi:MAG: hypothetical protein ACYYKD_05680 [Rhodospirillales bacterium]